MSRRRAGLLSIALFAAAAAPCAPAFARGISEAALIAAARGATLRDIGAGEETCDAATRIDVWLKALVGAQAAAVRWSGGPCALVDPNDPSDAHSWPYCADAAISLRHPKDKNDAPLVEIYLEAPHGGRPGKAYAFRAIMLTKDGGDLSRARQEFEADWRARFPPGPGAPKPCEE